MKQDFQGQLFSIRGSCLIVKLTTGSDFSLILREVTEWLINLSLMQQILLFFFHYQKYQDYLNISGEIQKFNYFVPKFLEQFSIQRLRNVTQENIWGDRSIMFVLDLYVTGLLFPIIAVHCQPVPGVASSVIASKQSLHQKLRLTFKCILN